MPAQRTVIITLDSLAEILKEFLMEEDIPKNARAVCIRINPAEQEKLAVEVESPDWPRDQAPVEAKFHRKQIFAAS